MLPIGGKENGQKDVLWTVPMGGFGLDFQVR